uniref:Uncharacterized protein n=1 Tax=Strongyloides stercoralis TaxID=6248 RepID=A0A0K0E5H6_STRER
MSGEKDSYIPGGLFNISKEKETEMKMDNSYFKFGGGSFNMFSQIFSKPNLVESTRQPLDGEKEKKNTEINRLCVMYGC